MQDDLTNEIARVLVETQAATVENRALALRPIIARERENAAAAQKERDAAIADSWAEVWTAAAPAIAAAIRSADNAG